MALKPYGLCVERLFDGEPVLSPTENWWESGVTFNSAAIYLERSPENDPIIEQLLAGAAKLTDPDISGGIVALHYRARPAQDAGFRWNRSFVGLAVFTPELRLLKRYADPVISPGTDVNDFDHLGVEDPRITRIGGKFYAVYCGCPRFPESDEWKSSNCLAESQDLLHWTKLGPISGDVNAFCNKDGVLFPDKIDGEYVLMHRPMLAGRQDHAIHLGTGPELDGPFLDRGPVLHAMTDPACSASWAGAGSVPIPLGDSRYLVVYHTGNRLRSADREYVLDAAIFNFTGFPGHCLTSVVESRVDRFMVPQTENEQGAPFADSVANVVFTCGTYIFDGNLYIIYGGGDTYIMAARLPVETLLRHLDDARARTAPAA